MKVSVEYEHVTRETVTEEVATLDELLHAIGRFDRPRIVVFHLDNGQTHEVRMEYVGESTGVR